MKLSYICGHCREWPQREKEQQLLEQTVAALREEVCRSTYLEMAVPFVLVFNFT